MIRQDHAGEGPLSAGRPGAEASPPGTGSGRDAVPLDDGLVEEPDGAVGNLHEQPWGDSPSVVTTGRCRVPVVPRLPDPGVPVRRKTPTRTCSPAQDAQRFRRVRVAALLTGGGSRYSAPDTKTTAVSVALSRRAPPPTTTKEVPVHVAVAPDPTFTGGSGSGDH